MLKINCCFPSITYNVAPDKLIFFTKAGLGRRLYHVNVLVHLNAYVPEIKTARRGIEWVVTRIKIT